MSKKEKGENQQKAGGGGGRGGGGGTIRDFDVVEAEKIRNNTDDVRRKDH